MGSHLFPKNDNLRKKWEAALKMGKAASATMKVCSAHFVPADYFPSSKYELGHVEVKMLSFCGLKAPEKTIVRAELPSESRAMLLLWKVVSVDRGVDAQS